MSKEELQVNFRMPASLKADLELAAKKSGRSLTAEVVARLNLSMLAEGKTRGDLLPADEARRMSEIARQSIPSTMKMRILEAVERAVSMGHTTASVALKDLELDSIPASDSMQLYDAFSEMLSSAGYSFEWDAPDSLWIDFDPRDHLEDVSEWGDEPMITRKGDVDEDQQRRKK